ncbi:glucokinase [Pseudomonas sp. BTN1]|uniref:glucokinase n=1 Tax=Pseudomonas sp. BTN1 TaxID=1750647 RepID=UPI00093E68F8|nr:glucokinase [Pseudomonas sp. BTN1]OKO46415.1 glucokinase [Pseudomonas sp. BTN1]
MKLALVGDIGGTNARFALWRDQELHSIRVHATADHGSPEEAIKVYLKEEGLEIGDIGAVCLSVAGPVSGDEFKFTNNHWRLSKTRFKPGEFRVVCEGTPEPLRPAVVIGPGTGLGVGTLLDLGAGRWAALPGEGGHVDLPLSSPRETQLWQHIYSEIGHVSAETALSGGGLPRLYRAICAVDGHEPVLDTPEAITAAGLAGDPVAMEVLDQFSIWLGRVAGNNVLTTGGRGGVYIVGGVIPRFADFFIASGFAKSFADKGCMSDYFKGIPVWLVTAPYSGLTGAGVALEQAFA